MSDLTPPPPSYGAPQYGAVPPNHKNAVLALVLGIVSFACSCGIFTGIPAYIIGKKAEREILASNGALGGAGLAKAGWIMGLIAIILGIIGLVVFVILLAVGGFSSSIDTSTY